MKKILHKIKYNSRLFLLTRRIKTLGFHPISDIVAIQRILPYTMLTPNHLYQLMALLRSVQVTGEFVECGVFKGGSAALTAWVQKNKQLYLYDSFEGFPEADKVDIRPVSGSLFQKGRNKADVSDVRQACKLLRIDPNRVHIHKGFFSKKVFKSAPQKIAFLHLDVDLYESHMICLESLYPLLVEGGILLLNDYPYLPGARKAVHDYFAKKKVSVDWPTRLEPMPLALQKKKNRLVQIG